MRGILTTVPRLGKTLAAEERPRKGNSVPRVAGHTSRDTLKQSNNQEASLSAGIVYYQGREGIIKTDQNQDGLKTLLHKERSLIGTGHSKIKTKMERISEGEKKEKP